MQQTAIVADHTLVQQLLSANSLRVTYIYFQLSFWHCHLISCSSTNADPQSPTTSQSSQKRSHTLVMLRPTREPQEDRDSPDPAEITPEAVGTYPVPAGGGSAEAGKWDWVSPPAPGAPQLPAVRGWDSALPAGGAAFPAASGPSQRCASFPCRR